MSKSAGPVLRLSDLTREGYHPLVYRRLLLGGHYRNQWWVPAGRRVLLAMGIHGQFLFVDVEARIVIALLSTWPTPLDDARRRLAAATHPAPRVHRPTHGDEAEPVHVAQCPRVACAVTVPIT